MTISRFLSPDIRISDYFLENLVYVLPYSIGVGILSILIVFILRFIFQFIYHSFTGKKFTPLGKNYYKVIRFIAGVFLFGIVLSALIDDCGDAFIWFFVIFSVIMNIIIHYYVRQGNLGGYYDLAILVIYAFFMSSLLTLYHLLGGLGCV